MKEIECIKCKSWYMAAKESGYHSGMCEECFNQNYVAVTLSYQPKRQSEEKPIK